MTIFKRVFLTLTFFLWNAYPGCSISSVAWHTIATRSQIQRTHMIRQWTSICARIAVRIEFKLTTALFAWTQFWVFNISRYSPGTFLWWDTTTFVIPKDHICKSILCHTFDYRVECTWSYCIRLRHRKDRNQCTWWEKCLIKRISQTWFL